MGRHRLMARLARIVVLAGASLPLLAGCGDMSSWINTKTKFSSAEYGVKASPRVTTSRHVPKGGGRYQVGKPYKVAGQWYTPKDDPNYDATGSASWYGPNFHGRKTANGEVFDLAGISAAHPTLPLPSYVRVTNLENNHSIIVRVNDRGPYVHGRLIDVSERAAAMLGFKNKGSARVRVKYVGQAPLEGDDTRFLLASYDTGGPLSRQPAQPDIRVAQLDAPARTAPRPAHLPERAPDVAPRFDRQPLALASIPARADNSGLQAISVGLGEVREPENVMFYAPPGFDAQKTGSMIDTAFAATKAMATRAGKLDKWRNSVDADARHIDLELGAFTDTETISGVSEAFALLGAVEEDSVRLNGREATLLRLTYLKPGVTRGDVLDLVRQYDLRHVVLRN